MTYIAEWMDSPLPEPVFPPSQTKAISTKSQKRACAYYAFIILVSFDSKYMLRGSADMSDHTRADTSSLIRRDIPYVYNGAGKITLQKKKGEQQGMIKDQLFYSNGDGHLDNNDPFLYPAFTKATCLYNYKITTGRSLHSSIGIITTRHQVAQHESTVKPCLPEYLPSCLFRFRSQTQYNPSNPKIHRHKYAPRCKHQWEYKVTKEGRHNMDM
jgi:hypothetical protein